MVAHDNDSLEKVDLYFRSMHQKKKKLAEKLFLHISQMAEEGNIFRRVMASYKSYPRQQVPTWISLANSADRQIFSKYPMT